MDFTIIQAEPGLRAIYDFEDEPIEQRYLVCEPIVAWRIETEVQNRQDFKHFTFPITTDGSSSAVIGFVDAAGRVTQLDGGSYESFDAFVADVARREKHQPALVQPTWEEIAEELATELGSKMLTAREFIDAIAKARGDQA